MRHVDNPELLELTREVIGQLRRAVEFINGERAEPWAYSKVEDDLTKRLLTVRAQPLAQKRKQGDPCWATNGAPARYVGGASCLWVSAQDNDLCVSEVSDAYETVPDPEKAVLPSDREVAAAAYAHRYALGGRA